MATGDLRFVVQVLFIVFVLELIGFAVSNSLALLSDSFFVLAEFLFFFMVLRRMRRKKIGMGMVLATLVVFALALSVIYFSVYRFMFGTEVRSLEMLVFAVTGLGMGTWVMRKVRKRYVFDMKESFVHVLSRSLPSFLVIAGGVWIVFTGEMFVDYLFASLIALIAMAESIILFRDSAFLNLGVRKSKTYLFKTVL